MVSGGQCVMTAGQTLTHKLCAENLVTGNVKYILTGTYTCTVGTY